MLNFTPESSALQWFRGMGNGSYSQFITSYLCHSFFLRGKSLHTLAPVWGPSWGRQSSLNFSTVSPSQALQFFMSCCSVGPFHGVQSFKNRLLHTPAWRTSMGCRCMFVRHWGSFWQLFTDTTPGAPLPCKPCHANLISASKLKGSRFVFLAVVLKKVKWKNFGR